MIQDGEQAGSLPFLVAQWHNFCEEKFWQSLRKISIYPLWYSNPTKRNELLIAQNVRWSESGCTWEEGELRDRLRVGMRKLLGIMGMFYLLTGIWVAQGNAFAKSQCMPQDLCIAWPVNLKAREKIVSKYWILLMPWMLKSLEWMYRCLQFL